MNSELKLYSMFDRIAGVYYPPFVANNDNMAIRSFNYTCTMLKEQKPSDMELYLVGSFSQATCAITTCERAFLVRGQDNE